jgi:hypothetical protein
MGQAAPVTSATQAALRIVDDPYLQEAACEVLRLSNVVRTRQAGPPCPRTNPAFRGSPRGVGLEHAVGPIRLLILHQERPWLLPVVALTLLGLVYAAGYESGRARGKRSTTPAPAVP